MILRIFQDTPRTYPRPSTNSLLKAVFSFGALGMLGVCSRVKLGVLKENDGSKSVVQVDLAIISI